jgi:XrtN system VIT domain protein
MKDHSAIRLFNLGNNLSPYLKTLKEYRTFLYDSGNADELVSLLSSNQFVKSIESDQQIVIDNAGIAITANPGESSEKAPDHLMRLFAYNHILQKRGRDMFGETAWEDELVAEARKAYVVTPVSSLVVLETQKDYDRFDIKDEGNSLKNASVSSNGAVPEPHEWALILLVLLIVSYIRFPNLFKSKRNS